MDRKSLKRMTELAAVIMGIDERDIRIFSVSNGSFNEQYDVTLITFISNRNTKICSIKLLKSRSDPKIEVVGADFDKEEKVLRTQ